MVNVVPDLRRLRIPALERITHLYKGIGVPLHAMKAPGVRGGIAPTHCQPRH
jgi:hypothetical protein